jgi:hypothetical protein
MIKFRKSHPLKAASPARSAGGSGRLVEAAADTSDKVSTLFAGIHASDQFTFEAAHRLFAGVRRKK